MSPGFIIQGLTDNHGVFEKLLKRVPKEAYLWRPPGGSWSLLEVVCHLYDEEREDFRARTRLALHPGQGPLRPINPQAWVTERGYYSQDYPRMLENFLKEREQSALWLNALERPDWSLAFLHPELGPMTAHRLLANWLAHDYHHIRQINRIKYGYLKELGGEDLSYAGNWAP